jgi:glutaredoxin 3
MVQQGSLGLLTKFESAMVPQLSNITKMSKSIFYHAGCPVSAEHDILNLIGADQVEVVNIGEDRSRIGEAESAGIKSVPALVTPNGNVLHINFGASLEDVKG